MDSTNLFVVLFTVAVMPPKTNNLPLLYTFALTPQTIHHQTFSNLHYVCSVSGAVARTNIHLRGIEDLAPVAMVGVVDVDVIELQE